MKVQPSVMHLLMQLVSTMHVGEIASGDNVCRTIKGYFTRENCYYNPDQFLEVPEIVTRHGYRVETHDVMTSDGYVLRLFRIPSRKLDSRPVLLMHGLSLSSMSFVNTGNKSLAFVLADNNFDVWLGNYRGTRYSLGHKTFDHRIDIRYWTFSFHEIGAFDIPAKIRYIYTLVRKPVIYIGYSIGTSTGYIYNILYPEEARGTMRVMVSLSPIVFLKEVPTLFGGLRVIFPVLERYINKVYNGQVFGIGSDITNAYKKICTSNIKQMLACYSFWQLVYGRNMKQLDPETLPVTMSQNVGDSVSIRMAGHILQLITHGKFQQYDYGTDENLLFYDSKFPPLYNLSEVSVPTYLYYAENDFFATVPNVIKLHKELRREVRLGLYKIPYRTFNHDDFIRGKDVKYLVYDHLVNLLSNL